MTEQSRFISALKGESVDTTPVWLMRQAGRYLPEYRQLRERAGSFMALCQDPPAACEVTLQPLARFDLDAAILFSDILTIPAAMGLGLYFVSGEGPHFEHPVRTPEQIDALRAPDMATDLAYVPEAARLVARELDGSKPLIGFAGSPWTLATYMVEGGPSKIYRYIKALAYDEPAALHRLLSLLADTTAAYLNAQIAAGAEAVQIFDTWGGTLSTSAFETFSLPYIRQIIDQLDPAPVIVFTKGGGGWLERLADCGADALGLDQTVDIGSARERVGHRVALQGNADPALLYARPDAIRSEVASIIESFGPHSGHIFNLGHGVTPEVPPDRVAAFVDAVHEFGAR